MGFENLGALGAGGDHRLGGCRVAEPSLGEGGEQIEIVVLVQFAHLDVTPTPAGSRESLRAGVSPDADGT
jgi:hypothetical protein